MKEYLVWLPFVATLLQGWVVQSSSLGIPTVTFNTTGGGGSFPITKLKAIVVDSQFKDSQDDTLETLIPPTLTSFAQTFSEDVQSTFGINTKVTEGTGPESGTVFLTIGTNEGFVDAAGRNTSEGYAVEVSSDRIVITGASALGVWWGTRTVLQQAILGNNSIPAGKAVDSPGWSTRGIMLDIARHYYPPSFLTELCAYISFWKQNTFHVHLSDNLFNNPSYTPAQRASLYSAFRINSPSPSLSGLDKRKNESYTPEVFEDVQTQCAKRGVTIIPEIEAPGHALVISQWKPQLALAEDESLLDISHPETIPTMQTIWREILPLFKSKSVHIGADEYDSTLADDYIRFVNTMSSFILSTSSKRIRIWGTNEPSNTSSVSKNITIQHWEWFEDDPVALLDAGYEVINSDDAFYIVSKFSASYPQQLNLTRIFHGDPTKPGGGAFAPYIFDVNRATHNPERSNPAIPGHIAAQWNDYGNNASTVLEAYYAWREGLAALGDKQWGGALTEDEYPAFFAKLQPKVPGQNLDRAVPSQSDLILSYDFAQEDGGKVRDGSGNGYDASLEGGARLANGTLLLESPGGQASLTTPLQSKGRPYTLSFSIFPSASSLPGGTIFSSSDASLLLGNGTLRNVMFIENGNPYVLNYTLPAEVWTDVELVGREDGVTALRVSSRSNSTGSTEEGMNEGIEEEKEMPFLTRLGINGESFEWRNISIVAPLARIGGSGFVGRVRDVRLKGSA